ncbi:ribokinase [Actinomadura rupiterrae]|uniref:ribokinase n=1 Tax=Actinomadura rupiterrae TaxID=559627 RepID=UPI0020A25FFB|nr:ribokinase [Actinomadura rupiterrae]MCP2339464.1 ribokinase [Actinomadura rupiterrae]
MAHEVVVVGSVNADLVVRVDRRPGPGETVLGSDLATLPGGKGANQAVAAGRLGGRVAILARTGDDGHGTLLRGALDAAGVDVSRLLVSEGPSGVALITVGPDSDNSIIVSPGANGRLTEHDVLAARDVIGAAKVVSLQLEIPQPTVVCAARAAADAGARVVLNLSPAVAVPSDLLALADPLVVNEHEAAFLLPGREASDEPETLATALLELGPKSVVITRGPDGALVGTPDGTASVPSPRVEPVDTTGAGDAFTAALCLRLARGDDLETAARFAARVGAAAVLGEGAQSSYPAEGDELPS